MRIKLLIFLMIMLCSCGRNVTQKTDGIINVINLFSEPESEIIKVSDVATDLEYLPLQTTENSLVKSITKIVTCDNKFYIRNGYDDILCFDRKGNFLYKLNKAGRGPGEYTFITDFDISSDNKLLIVLTSGNILVFKNTATEFIFDKSINLRQPFPSKISMIPGTTNILLSIDPITAPEQSLNILINFDCDTLFFKPNHYRYDKEKITTRYRMVNESLQYKFENNACFKEEFSDTVFFVNRETNEFQPRLIFDSHGRGFLPRVRYDIEYAKSNSADLYWVYSIIETPRYIIYTYEHNMTRNKMLFDKSVNNKFKIGQMNLGEDFKNTMKDDLNGGPVFDPMFCSDNYVYSIVDALTLKKYVAGEDFQDTPFIDLKKKDELKKMANSMRETDNPLLLIMTPKK